MKLEDLRPNSKNPRKISSDQKRALKASVEKFGDLSGFVYNRRTKALISGHQRQGTLPPDSKIKIEVKHETPTAAMTVAEGYVEIGAERFKYREVDADPTWEMEALLAANKHGGSWDADLLRVAIADTPGLNLETAGFSIPELRSMNIEFKMPEVRGITPVATVLDEPAQDFDEAQEAHEAEETDEEYVANTPETSEQIHVERPSLAAVNPFEKIDEKMNVLEKRFVIIIDCTSADHKAALKEKIQAEVVAAGGKFF